MSDKPSEGYSTNPETITQGFSDASFTVSETISENKQTTAPVNSSKRTRQQNSTISDISAIDLTSSTTSGDVSMVETPVQTSIRLSKPRRETLSFRVIPDENES